MFIVLTEIAINYLLYSTDEVLLNTDFDVTLTDPDDNSEYIKSPIIPENYVAPTANSNGGIRFTYTFTKPGTWKIVLSAGEENTYFIHSTYNLKIISPITEIYTQVNLG